MGDVPSCIAGRRSVVELLTTASYSELAQAAVAGKLDLGDSMSISVAVMNSGPPDLLVRCLDSTKGART